VGVGCILWSGSPRACDPAEAARIAAALRRRAQVCGVFVNAPLDEVAGMVDGIGLTMVQLHGDEGPAFCSEVARRTGAKVIKAAAVRGKADIRALEAFHTDYHLLDAHQAGMRGGTGETFDWELVRSRRSRIPLVLSGGLRPENVVEAITAVRAVRRRHGQRDRGAPRRQGPREGHGLHRGGQLHARRGPGMSSAVEHRYGRTAASTSPRR
jgi:phosphoribosylanthranilate isomerase